jgi:aminopeptidase N
LVKGTFFYHMLRQRVGDDVFFSVLRDVIRTHEHRILSLDELRAAYLATAPHKGLSQFFEQWLDRTGAPVFTATLSCATDEAGEQQTTVVLTQTQPGAAYIFPMEVAFEGGAAPHRETVPVQAAVTTFRPSGAGCYSGVTLDPDHNLFIWRPEYAAAKSAN